MTSYEGTKFRPTGGYETKTNRYGETVKREIFVCTSGYKKYLEEKKKQELLDEVELYKQKLQMQFEKYGSVDDIDFNYYLALLKKVS